MQDEQVHKTYVLKDPRDSAVRYVGITRFPLEERLQGHLRMDVLSNPHKHAWFYELSCLGLLPDIELVETQPTRRASRQSEAAWFTHYYNQGAELLNVRMRGYSRPSRNMRACTLVNLLRKSEYEGLDKDA